MDTGRRRFALVHAKGIHAKGVKEIQKETRNKSRTRDSRVKQLRLVCALAVAGTTGPGGFLKGFFSFVH